MDPRKLLLVGSLLLATLIVICPRLGTYSGDADAYINLTRFFRGERVDLQEPFNYRILVPWLVSLIPLKIEQGFGLVNLISSFGCVLILFSYLRKLGFKHHESWLGSLCLAISLPMFAYYGTVRVDAAAMVFFMGAIYGIRQNFPIPLVSALISLGVAVRETNLVLVPLAIWEYWKRNWKRKKLWMLGIPAMVEMLIRIWMSGSMGYFWMPHYLWKNLSDAHTYFQLLVTLHLLIPFSILGLKGEWMERAHLTRVFLCSSLVPLYALFGSSFAMDARYYAYWYPALIPLGIRGAMLSPIWPKLIRVLKSFQIGGFRSLF